MRRGIAIPFVLIALAAPVGIARAGDAPPCGPPPCAPTECEPTPCPHGRVDPYVDRAFDATLEDGRGRLSALRAGLEGRLTVPVSSRLTWNFGGRVERAHYDLSKPDAIVPGPGRLLEDGTLWRFGAALDVAVAPPWGVSAGAYLSSAGVPGAKFEDTLSWGVLGSVKIPIGEGTALRLGLALDAGLEHRLSAWPILDIEGVGTGTWDVDLRGTSIRATYPVAPCFRAGFGGRYDWRDWRLSESDRVPNGIFRDIRVAAGLLASWTPTADVSVDLALWVDLYHEVRVDDRGGHVVTAFEAGPSPSLMLSVGIRF